MHGILSFLKPPGMTSHDAVSFVRRIAGTKRVGHTGTLDPAAAGVLPICIGQATRLVPYLQEGSKEYIAEITFGHETDTLDATGKVVARGDASSVSLASLRRVLDSFRGTIRQTPPLYSAIKQDGRKLYELARGGADESQIEIASREVVIHQLWVTRFVTDQSSTRLPVPCAMLHIECGGGTYIRSLVRDIGRALGCFATMTFLVRTRNGPFAINRAQTTEHIASDLKSALIPIMDALTWCALVVVEDDVAAEALSNGRVLTVEETERALKSNTYSRKIKHMPGQHITHARANGVHDLHRALFVNSSHQLAVIAVPLQPVAPICYKPEKVFRLDSTD